MNKLTKLGTYLLPSTLVAGIFGMNVIGARVEKLEFFDLPDWVATIFLMIITTIITYIIINKKE